MNMELDRYTVCLEKGLLGRLDEIVAERGYHSRSQAMADFIRRAVSKKDWRGGRECAASVSVVYGPRDKRPAAAIEKILSGHARRVLSSAAHTLPGGRTMVTAFLRGRPGELEKIADSLRALKGVSHGSFSIVAPL
ncbi:MAG: CopG family ribbon-helix-helix protein [Elusimicrobiales bacterium]|nr:CopG family ribbon-helix-helix protein [Elusimicrobiales bacterium]